VKVVIGFIEFLIFKNESQAERADIFKGKLGHKSTNPRPLGGRKAPAAQPCKPCVLTTGSMHIVFLEKGKVLRKHNLNGEKTASVLLKLFINGYERCHTTDAPKRRRDIYFQM